MDYLINNKDFPLLPKPQEKGFDLYTQLNSPLDQLIRREIRDENNNSIGQINPNDEESLMEEYYHRVYLLFLETCTMTYLNSLFEFGFCRDLFTYNNLIDFLNSLDFFKNSDFMKIIEPLIKEYFNQMLCYLIEPQLSNFTLFIDSICSKIEYMVKTISSSNGIITTQVRTDDVTATFRLEQTLKNEQFIALTEPNGDNDFLRKILIQPGFNLRNKSTHCLDLGIYNFSNANLLLMCFLRLIKYL